MPALTIEQRSARALALGLSASLVAWCPSLALASTSSPASSPAEETAAADEHHEAGSPGDTPPAQPEQQQGEPEADATGELEEQQPEPEPEADPAGELEPTVTEIEPAEAPTGGGVAGAIVDPDDPNATRAQSDLEGESLDDDLAGVPERLPKLQAAGWWTTFGAVALATTGGILAGVAETRQDQAERLAYTFDLETGRSPLYGEVASEYEQLLRDGQTFQWMARGFIIAGAAVLVAGITCFAVDGARRRKSERSADARLRLDAGPGGLRLRF